MAPLVHWTGTTGQPIHRWFRYREGFSPALLNALNLGRRVLDPFAGSGSVMVGAAQSARVSVGIDVNPLAVFITEVKLNPFTRREFGEAEALAAEISRSWRHAQRWPLPELSVARKVFEPDILEALMRIRTTFAGASPRVRAFFLLGWIAILETVGSYFKEGNGIKYRRRLRTKNGYVERRDGEWQRQRFGGDHAQYVVKAFGEQVTMMVSDAKHWRNGDWVSQRILEGSALDLNRIVGNARFDGIVFSPPYANRFDYFESQKVELWFGGFVRSYEDLNLIRKRSLRSHLGADLQKPALVTTWLEPFLELMDRHASSWRMGVPTALRGYFADMRRVMEECYEALEPGGRCAVVVGNSAYAGVIVPTDAILARIGMDAGFSNVRLRVVRHLTVAAQQRAALSGLEQYMRESIVEFEKC